MRRLPAFALVALALARPLAAQDMQALARAYVETPAVQDMMSEMMAPASLAGTIQAGLPPGVVLTAAQQQAIAQVAAETLGSLRPQMERVMIDASARHFTPAELQALIDFHGSEAGASAARKMQPFFQDTMAQIMPALQQAVAAASPRIAEIIRSRP